MIAATETKKIPASVTDRPNWVSLIYLPGNEINAVTQDFLISGIRQNRRIPFYRAFQFIHPATQENLSICVHPGTNLGYHVRNNMDDTEVIRKLPTEIFDTIFNQELNKVFLASTILAVYPEKSSDLNELPRYSHFSDDNALMLLNNHTHEKWIDLALVGETRSVIKTAAEARKLQIIEHRRKLQEGIV